MSPETYICENFEFLGYHVELLQDNGGLIMWLYHVIFGVLTLLLAVIIEVLGTAFV